MTEEKATKTIIGERIRYYRTLGNLTQDDLAERTGSNGSYIGRIERGGTQRQSVHLGKNMR